MYSRQGATKMPTAAQTASTGGGKPAVVNPAAQTGLPVWMRAGTTHLPASLFGQVGLQAKLTVSQPGDAAEQEADRMAEQVLGLSDTLPLVQRKCACGGAVGPDGECAACHAKRLGLQRANVTSAAPSRVPESVHAVLRSPGQPLDTATRTFMEPRFGANFSQVRIHIGRQAAQAARDVSALAYTMGHNVVFGA